MRLQAPSGGGVMLKSVFAAVVSLAMPAIAHSQPESFRGIEEVLKPAMEAAIEKGALGVAVVAVAEGEVIFRAGMGSAQVGKLNAIDPATTQFRLASLGKSVVAMTALRLEARGLLDLEEDISTYLGEEAPAMPLGPITMYQLLSHTSGMDAEPVGDAARSPVEAIPLDGLIRDHLPPQRFRPGQVFIYSNHGYALAGRVVEKVVGEPFSEVAQREVFAPLGMSGSRFEQGRSSDRLAHSTVDGRIVPSSVSNVQPADGWVGTADDVARYLKAHLSLGPEDPLIKAGLHAATFGHTSDLPHQGLGWEARRWGQDRVLSHTGGVDGFASIMVIVPEQKFGMAILLNSRRPDLRGSILDEVRKAFFQTPRDIALNRVTSGAGVDLNDVDGLYLSENRTHGRLRWMSRLGLAGGLLDVRSGESVLDVGGTLYALQSSDDPELSGAQHGYRIHFDRAANGSLYAFEGRDAYRKLSFLQRPGILISALVLGLVASSIRFGAMFVRIGAPDGLTQANYWLQISAVCFLAGAVFLIAGLAVSGDISFGLHWLYQAGEAAVLLSIGLLLVGIIVAATSRARVGWFYWVLTSLTIAGHLAALEAGLSGTAIAWI